MLRSDGLGPDLCPLCGASRRIHSARFRQLYSQAHGPAFPLKWFECRACAGWFAYPVPPPEIIQRNWDGVAYTDPDYEFAIAEGKALVHQRLLHGLARRIRPGPLLDFGSNFGQYLLVAAAAGWAPYGFDPCRRAVEAARAKGLHVRCGWSLEDAGFPDNYFAAITAIDVFSYVWHPVATLGTFYRLLRPGGVLGMRLSNKRLVVGLARALSRAGVTRDAWISRLLQNQFHSIGLTSLTRILRERGFTDIVIEPHAKTGLQSALHWRTRLSYRLADALYLMSATKVNLSPGVLLFARRTDDSS